MQIPSEFTALLSAARQGDRASFERLFTELRPHLEQLASPYADPRHADESVSDLVQESGLRIWERLEQFRGEATDSATRGVFLAWIEQIVKSTGLNAVRSRNALKRHPPRGQQVVSLSKGTDGKRPAKPGDVPATESTPSAKARLSESTRLVKRAVETLEDPLEQKVVSLRFFSGVPLTQIAEQLGITYDVARGRLQSAMQKLERELDGLA